MTSSLLKKRRITRRSILRWMQDSFYLSLGLSCAWGAASFSHAGELPVAKSRTTAAGRAAVDTTVTSRIKPPASKLPAQVSKKKTVRTANRVVRAQNENEFEPEPIAVGQNDVVPPPPAIGQARPPQADAIQRLRDRSAKARWDELHQEWLRARKARQSQANTSQEEPQPPAAEQATDNGAATENSFDAGTTGAEPRAIPQPEAVGEVPAGEGVTVPSVPAGRVFLQSQQKDTQPMLGETEAQTKERLRLELEAEEALKVPPPIRDPGSMPKIGQIDPNPVDWALPAGRPVPDLDAKRYVRLETATFNQRAFPEFTYTFEATNVYSNPLYFEDPKLERYGHTLPAWIQPTASVARFGGQVVLLPYQIAMKPFKAKIYPLGWYNPGDYVPYRTYQFPWNTKAAAAEAATILGFSYALP